MFYNVKDFYLPFIIIELIIGYQISVYFLYQYYKVKDEKIGLNKLLLAYGLLYGLGLSGVIIRTFNSYYIEDVVLYNFFLYFTHIIIALAAISFLLIISSKSFQEIIKTSISRIVSVIAIIISVLIILIQIKLIQFIFIMISIIIGSLYMVFFHLNLIKHSKGKIRKRIILIFVGESFLISTILIGAEEIVALIFQQHISIIPLISIPIILISLMIIFLGVFKFPIFLEFNWKENLTKLFIIDRQSFNLIYTFDFTELIDRKEKSKIEPLNLIKNKLFFSRGLIGINDIISSITYSDEEKIEKIRHGEFLILLKHGEEPFSFIIYALLIEKDMNSTRYFLKTIKNQFQELYRNILLNLDGLEEDEKNIFSSFDIIIKNILK